MGLGKTIEIFLPTGSFDGTVTAEIHNWSGRAIKVGRDDKDLDGMDELANPGVYFLFCGGPSDGVYIGESQNIQKRLKQHKQDYNSGKEKYYWPSALCFMDPALIINTKYLEARLVDDALKSKAYMVLTKASGIPPIKASAKADNENFIEHVKDIVAVLGYQVYSNNAVVAAQKPSNVYTFKGKNFDAKLVITSNGFVVLAGSKISSVVSNTMPQKLIMIRNDLIKKGIIDSNYVLQNDQVFGSVSSAAKFVCCYSTRGTSDWKDNNGIPIGKKII